MQTTTAARMGLLFSLCLILSACESTYYNTMESFGVHKRDIFIDRIEDVQAAQQEGQEQFKSALEQFKSVAAFDGGDLEDQYNTLNDEYEDSVDAAERISNHIEKVESVSEALFDEWQREIGEYSNSKLRNASKQQYRETLSEYKKLLGSMRRAESSMEPVLVNFKDNVLFLKHNLNARAIRSLKGGLSNINEDVSTLIKKMEISIKQSDAFIRNLKGE